MTGGKLDFSMYIVVCSINNYHIFIPIFPNTKKLGFMTHMNISMTCLSMIMFILLHQRSITRNLNYVK